MNSRVLPLIFCVLFFSGCALDKNDGIKTDNPAAGGQPEKPAPEERCGLENCHGLDFSCGPDVPDFCTEIYMLGDFCRQYAVCEIVNGSCRLVETEKLRLCIDCVSGCRDKEAQAAFECENGCRDEPDLIK